MEETIIAMLLADAGVSGLAGTRVFPNGVPQSNKDYPVVSVRRITGEGSLIYGGVSEFTSSTMQADVWGKKYKETKLLARAVKTALHGQKSGPILLIQVDGGRDSKDRHKDGTELHRVTQDLEIKHCE